MKYHNHYIIKEDMDLGESDKRLNCVYYIYNQSNVKIAVALTLTSAKDYIDSGYNNNYL